jgi:hypothetical protein
VAYTITIAGKAPVAGAVSATFAANSTNNAVALAITGDTATASGTTITYTPTMGYSSTDSFTYTATNTAGTSPAATVSITVTEPTLMLTPAVGALPGARVGSA